MILDYLQLAIKNLRKRKLRSWLTMIGIFVSIATIFVLISVSIGLGQAIEEQFRALGTDKLFILPRGQLAGPGSGGAVELTSQDLEVVEKVTGVKQATYFVASSVEVIFNDDKRFLAVAGLPDDGFEIMEEVSTYEAQEGRLLERGDRNVVVLGSQFKDNSLFTKPLRVGDRIEINGEVFRVKGILKTLGNPADDRNILMPVEDIKEITSVGDRIDQIIVQINQGEDINEIAERIERRLVSSRDVDKDNPDFIILTPEELLESFGNVIDILTAFLVGIAAISLLVGGIGIANTMYTSVLERTREIGVMKAVGAKNEDILQIFLIESGLLGLVGGIIGVFLGIVAAKLIEYVAANQLGTSLLQAAFPWYLIVGCLLFAFLSGAISGVWPAYQASKVKPVEALRYE